MSTPARSPAANTPACALVVDDERDIRELLVLTLGRMGLKCDTASSLHDARALLNPVRIAVDGRHHRTGNTTRDAAVVEAAVFP